MKKIVKVYFEKSVDSLILAISHFNSPWDRGRKEAVLIMLDRAFELLLKAIILHKGIRIREPYAKETIGHEKCVNICITNNEVKCLSEDQGVTIRIINSLRDAAQHDIVELSEQELYTYTQSGVTLYRDLLLQEFKENISNFMPDRVLPVSTKAPVDLHTMVETNFNEIKNYLRPHSRKKLDATLKLRSLAIIESSLQGLQSQPGEFDFRRIITEIKDGKSWQEIFPGVASLQLETNGTGINVDIRITKKEGEPVYLVPEGTKGASIIAVKRVDELGYYSLGVKKIAEKAGLTRPKTSALIWYLKLQDADKYFKVIKIDSSAYKRYSKEAYEKIIEARDNINLDEVWEKYKYRKTSQGTA